MSTRRLRVQWILACGLAALLTYSCNRPPEAGEDSSGSTKTPVVVEDSERGVPGWAEPNEGIEAFNRGYYATALGFFQPLAENGDAYAQVVLSKMYELGLGVAKNSGHAVRWDRKTAEQDFAPGQAGLAFSYRAGRGVAKDDGESVRWFRKAAIQGLADAQVHLGLHYEKGIGVAQDYAESVKWYRMAAEQGHILGLANLAASYFLGQGVARNYTEAAKWYRAAAEEGDPASQFKLGTFYFSRNAQAGERSKKPLAEKALLEPITGHIEHFYPKERVGLRKAIIRGKTNEVSEELYRQRGRLMRGQTTGETYRKAIESLEKRLREVAHAETLAVIEAFRRGDKEAGREAYDRLLGTGYYPTREEANKAIDQLAALQDRLAYAKKSQLPEIIAMADRAIDEYRETEPLHPLQIRRLNLAIASLSKSEQEDLRDWMEEQIEIAREGRVQPSPASSIPQEQLYAPRF